MATVHRSARVSTTYEADKLEICRDSFDEVLRKGFFYAPAFDIFGVVDFWLDFSTIRV